MAVDILHTYLVQCERFVFQMFRESIVDYGDIFWVDMSENLANTPKDQCQDAHFNQRQSSLCCTVQIGADDNTFHYHFSDYNTHNISYTGTVFDHLYSLNKKTMVFRVKSDNCAEQFKNRYVFGFWEHFSQTNNIPVLLFYGMAGHGKGLVDSMSSFGVKMPIRKAIVREDFWYKDSKEIERFLSSKFFEDPKNYYVLQPDELIKRNEEKGKYE